MKTKALLYCTKAKPYLVSYNNTNKHWYLLRENEIKPFPQLNTYNGKIVAECDYEVEKITPNNWDAETEYRILKESCLKEHQLFDYIIKGDENEKQKPFYAIHIKNLHIFDKPKELNEVYKIEKISGFTKRLTKFPHNMIRVSINHWDYATYNPDDIRIFIPVKPEEMCRIANREQTILVRKQISKEMLKDE